ncbi:hypothetical protein SODALDRAFT_331702 [Sodiomyces alkalinus F11]|uniref:Uncharacterized protein n=1 Tax=Sodiomyces alkalinus (strain CBS 110278 / VKM F-3762 / F11) TaxID=1314773 RepID=A0A3N2PYM9_SODAK|nr:hypothetical protein SODALDRAFT_331702 [Sodiomyces alkalinus F11]ROT39592.1 hypothetical protein SODALDRAFT_331702 [Sodiomyces alkalinus F11]
MQNQSFPMIYGLPLSWRLVPQDDSKEERAEWGQRHVENMLQNLLLRVMVPPGGRPHWRNKIRAQEWFPFNMWTFFRALVHLQDLGFDKESLFRGTNYVLSRTHITSEYGLKSHASDNRHGSWYVMTSVDLQPWSAELTTQCCLWQGLLDFVVGRDKDDTLLPHQIHKYGVKIAARGKEFTDERPEHIVVFVRRVHAFPMDDLHGILTGTVDRELRDVASSIRNEHCHIVTVWEWYEVEERAVFWMRDDVMEEMLRDYPTWDAMVYRTDVWTPVLGPDKTSPLDIVKWEQWGDQDNM